MTKHDLLRWRDRHQGHQIARYELLTGGSVRLPSDDPLVIPRLIKSGLRCEQCAEVFWLDEARPDEAFS